MSTACQSPEDGTCTVRSPRPNMSNLDDEAAAEKRSHTLDPKQEAAVAVLAKAAGPVFAKPYKGDLFGTRTNTIDGMLYLSRITVKDQLKNNVPTPLHTASVDTALPQHLDNPAQHMSETGYRAKKRQCAKTFERMIYSRLTPPSSNEFGAPTSKDKGMKSLLDNGIVPALVSLAAVPDTQTQSHCAKAFYGLAQVPCTRRLLVLHNIVGTISLLVRHGDATRSKFKQDLAAILGHITEESFLEDKLLHDGVDRVLVKLYHGHNAETKRIVALAYFNLSHNASQLKHYIDAFTQCITTVCKTMNAAAHPSKATLLLVQALFNLTQTQTFHNALMAENAHRILSLPVAHFCKCHQHKSRPTEPVEDDAIEFGLKGLFLLAATKNGRQHIVQDGLVPSIVACLSLGGAIADTVCSILYQLSMDESCRDAMVHDMATIVDNIVHISTYGYFTMSWVFRHVCATRAIYPSLVVAGVVPVLMQMTRDAHDEIKLNGISCMCCLLQCDLQLDDATGCTERIIVDLVQFLQSPIESIVVFAITALFNLSCNDTLIPFLSAPSTGLVDALKHVIRPPSHSHRRPTEKVTNVMLPLIYQLAPTTRVVMLQSGFFDFVATAISTTSGAPRHAALDTMVQFALDPAEFPQGTDDVRALVKALYTLKTNSDTIALRSCVSLLAHLTTSPKNRDVLLKTGCAVCLARICNTADDFIMGNCAYILYCLADTIEAVEVIVREEAIPVLIQLSRASNDTVKELCILTFCRISAHSNMETKLVEQGAIAASMIMALVATKSDQIKTLCIKIISNCLSVQAKHCTRTMIDHGVFWALSSLSTLPFADTKHACATCFCNLSSAYPLKMIEAGVPRALVQIVETGDGPTIVVGLQAIANLLHNDKACGILVNEGIVKILRRLVDDSNAAVAHAAAMVFLKTSRADDKCRIESIRNGLLPWMRSILSNESLVLQCLITLCDCTANRAAQVHMHPAHAMDILRIASMSTALTSATTPDRMGLTVQALYNLTCQPSKLLELVQAGAHNFLQQGLRADDRDLSSLCVLSLYNLTCVLDETALSALVASGLTQVLHDTYLLDLEKAWCVLSICNLALGKVNSSRIVMENGGVVLVDYVQSNEFRPATSLDAAVPPPLASTVAAAFRKLINPPGNQKAMVELGVVLSFVRLLSDATAPYDIIITCLESLTILTRNKDHIWRSLSDGLLGCILDISDRNEAQSTPDPTIGAHCFTVLSNLCAVDFDSAAPTHPHNIRANANVIAYLTQLSEYSTKQNPAGCTPIVQPARVHSQVHSRFLAPLPPGIPCNNAHVSPSYSVPWEKCCAHNCPALPSPIGCVWSPVNISVFTKHLPDSFKLPRFEILEKIPLVRDYADTSEAAHRYVVGIKGLVRLQVQAHNQAMLSLRRKKLAASSHLDNLQDAVDTSVARPLSGKTRKEASSSKQTTLHNPMSRLRAKRSSSLKYLVQK
ncbi:hypothetical protein, variant [Aphanomyces invadans]|uniref:Armadillo repeat-containing domain-containing protein n=1 Tax=Aphanomyces invadans TaxID=157072 RepID=A0A024T8N5_9STRA|nr:hypothetical protein, variant [Aphanomyces invadans]ETV90349.1 hypothetical protein, variant [Aphanomyces invadans]|eukprot:XP_008881023.1 hypothetical protein, variant [Aphanomyces invadans]